MVATPSTMLELGTKAPYFQLSDYNRKSYSIADFKDKPLLIIFMCNHCPYVRHVISKLSELIKGYKRRGVSVVAINSNDVESYPADSPAKMRIFAAENSFSFPYLYDETQEVAKKYNAACTPDFFLFNSDHVLVYRGQMDNSRPGNNVPVTGENLTEAIECLLDGKEMPTIQKPSMGCNIKWKKGNEPVYFR